MTAVTDDLIASRILEVSYHVHKRMTVCFIELDSGFIVLGDAACIIPADFDESLGQSLAYARARSKLWAYFGFALAESMLRDLEARDGIHSRPPDASTGRPRGPGFSEPDAYHP